ncbi:FeoB-associated Cys-rich membrane protein [Loigolactobacillus zhaoyuanensis]|uniref:FeoB-associated Cys-rich membrane protein n=1 Tax=Loigolactobacillus zhaoyuanensis TaxID=2486017 RepID=A0ABW8UDI7_9LACO
MALFVNILITAAIIGLAFWQIVKVVRRSKQGKCAACDYKCEAQKMSLTAKRRPN